jgi:3-methyl-2-oxobutanoate hydroxymethyltransferase
MPVIEHVGAMTSFGIPVMGHVGMTPQYVHQSGGYRVQGKDQAGAERILEEAKALEEAGVFALVLECVPNSLASTITQELAIPTIGIGAGQGCNGQVLVLYDLLGLFDDFVPKFVKPYAHLKVDALQALRRYKEEVECGKFPTDAESYQ